MRPLYRLTRRLTGPDSSLTRLGLQSPFGDKLLKI